MILHRTAGSVIVAAALCALPAGAATLAWDNLTTATINSSRGPQTTNTAPRALVFSATASGDVASIDVPISMRIGFTGGADFEFAFYADGGTAPGAAIGGSAIGSTTSPGFTPEIVSVSGWTGVSLTAGSTYWLVAAITASSPAEGYWYHGDPAAAGASFASGDSGATWSTNGVSTLGGHLARIELTDLAAVPLPATLPLLGAAFLLIGARARRRPIA